MKINFLKPNNTASRKPLIIIVSLLLLLALTTGAAFAWKDHKQKTAARQTIKTNNTVKETEQPKKTSVKPEATAAKPEEAPVAAAVTEKTNTIQAPAPQKTTRIPTPIRETTPNKIVTPVATKTAAPANIPASKAPTNGIYSNAAAQAFVEAEVLRLVNVERSRVGVGTLTSVTGLSRAADIRVAEEAIPSFVGVNHTRPDGRSYATVYPEAGYTGYTAWGENLVWGYQSAFSYNQTNLLNLANKMFTNWKNSPGHYANMINGKYNQTGVGIALINQSGRTYWFGIQEFARK